MEKIKNQVINLTKKIKALYKVQKSILDAGVYFDLAALNKINKLIFNLREERKKIFLEYKKQQYEKMMQVLGR